MPGPGRDGFGNPATASPQACTGGFVEDNGDCDDTNPLNNTEADEICDGLDNDCDCDCDDNDEIDADADQHLLPASLCEGGPLRKDDCNDHNLAVHPWATNICNATDDDCDGEADEHPAADAACSDDQTAVTCGCARTATGAVLGRRSVGHAF